MFIGHYGASLLARQFEPRLRVSAIFVAAQWLDIVWCVLALAGVEHLRMVPGITASNGLDLYFMPYSHSLGAAILWGAAAFTVCRFAFSMERKMAALLAIIVSGHWVLDLVVHRHDLLVEGGLPKAGWGLWNYPLVAFLLEAGLLALGVGLALSQDRAKSKVRLYGLIGLAIVMAGIQIFVS